jgi:hypothetical protein
LRAAAREPFSCLLLEIEMATYNELLVSARDVDALASLVGDRRRNDRFEAEAADALADVLMNARRVPHDRLPADRVSMNSRSLTGRAGRRAPHGCDRSSKCGGAVGRPHFGAIPGRPCLARPASPARSRRSPFPAGAH